MFKRFSVFLLAFLLVVGNFSYASASPTIKTLPGNLEKKADTEKLEETDDPDKEVRVIVEMEDPAPIEKATQKGVMLDRKSTRLNSSHVAISYAVFCLKKKN